MIAAPGQLVQRETELRRIDAALGAAQQGQGRALHVEGPAGIGKTTLLEAARRRAQESGMSVLAGRGSELERGHALGVVRQCLMGVVHAEGEAERERLLAGAAALAAPVVLDGAQAGEPADPFRVLHGLHWLVANIATQRPALLIIDDVQWADEASLRFLAFLVRRVESLRAVVLVASRLQVDGGDQSPLWQARTDPAMDVLQPLPLDEAGVASFLAVRDPAVDQAFVAACHRASGGNPFLLGQLVTALRTERVPFTAEGTDRVSEITPPEVARRVGMLIAGLEPAARALARAVAILGDHATLTEAAVLAGLDADAARAAVLEVTRVGLLDDALPPRFRHPLLRSAVTASSSATDREAAHRRAAALLAERSASPDRCALHLLAVEPSGSAEDVATLRAAARRARHRGAPEPAAALLTRALAEPPAVDLRHVVLTELAEAEHAGGRSHDAIGHAAQAHEHAPDVASRARILDLWGKFVGPDLHALAALAPLVERGLRELDGRDRELMLRLRAQQLVGMLPDPDPDLAHLNTVMAEAEQLAGGTPGEAMVLGVLVFHHVRWSRTAADVRHAAERAARQAYALMAEGADSKAFSATVHGLRWVDALADAERLLLNAIVLARREGSSVAFAFGSGTLAEVRRRSGMLRDAEADARAAIAAADGWVLALSTGTLAACLLDQGRAEEAWHELAACGLTGPLGLSPPETEILLVRMRLRAAMGDRVAALGDWHDAQARPVRGAPIAAWLENHVVITDVLRANGDPSAARALATEALEASRQWGTPGAIGEALRAVARAEGGDSAVETLREAVSHLERAPTKVVHARALVDLGAALRRRGDRRDSREPLRAGLALAEGCGAGGLAETARQELAAGGLRIPKAAQHGGDLLTASEQRIAGMAASGASNPDIAQALFVTVKTVEMHLTNSYRKLGIARRTQLSQALHQRRQDAP